MLFWMLKMLVTLNKPCHVPHESLITTLGTIFIEIFLLYPTNVSDFRHTSLW